MYLRYLDYLRLIIKHGGYAAAAQEAGVSQPAMSFAMQSLERELGCVLFEKAGRKNVPTPAALSVAQRAAGVTEQVASIASSVRRGRGKLAVKGTALHVGMTSAAGLLYGPTIQQTWHDREPHGILHIRNAGAHEMLTALAGGELDLVIAPRPRRYPLSGLKHLPLYRSTPRVCGRKGHPLRNAHHLADIAEASWAVTGEAGTPSNVIEEAHRVRGLSPPNILVRCADQGTLLHLVSQSDFLCVVPHKILLRDMESQGVRPFNIMEGLPQYEVSAFSRCSPVGTTHPLSFILEALAAVTRS